MMNFIKKMLARLLPNVDSEVDSSQVEKERSSAEKQEKKKEVESQKDVAKDIYPVW